MDLRRAMIHLLSFLFVIVTVLSTPAHASVAISLATSASPSSGQAGVQSFTFIASNVPSGTINASSVEITLEPKVADTGPTVTTAADAVLAYTGTGRRFVLKIPTSLQLSAKTEYLASIAGTTAAGEGFASTNKSSLIITPFAQLTSATPACVNPGATATVELTGSFTTFVQGTSNASFGSDVIVGAAAEGAMGQLTVAGSTSASAVVTVNSAAIPGPRTVSVKTNLQEASSSSIFSVCAPQPANQPPTANAGISRTITLQPGQTDATVQLDGGGSIDTDGTVSSYNWSGIPDPADIVNPVVSLPPGTYTFTLVVSDNQGAASAPATVTITVNPALNPPPAPVISPIATPTNITIATISGTATAAVTVRIYAGANPIGSVVADGQGNFSLANVTLAEGSNTFTAIAVDAAGSESPASSPVTVILDTKAPVITITAPADNSIASQPAAVLKGVVDDTTAVLTLNGAAVTLNGAAFEYPVTLIQGVNIFTFSATDPVGNTGTASVTVTLDSTAPVVTITAPLAGFLTNVPQVTVTGTVSKPNCTVTLNGAAVPVSGQSFQGVYTLAEDDNTLTVQATDRTGKTGTAAVTVTLDSQAPTLALNVPAAATAGANIQLGIQAVDNRGVTLAELRANGVPLWSAAPISAGVNDNVAYLIPPELAAGATVSIQAKGYDAAGNIGVATTLVTIGQGAAGPGYLQGKVLDDSRGLLLAGASVDITDASGNRKTLNTAADGGYFQELPSGNALVAVSMAGFTTVERLADIRPAQKDTSRDARLTPLSDRQNLLDAAGGSVKVAAWSGKTAPTIDLTVPAGALAGATDLRLTPVSNQGLMGVLPGGWSPLAAVDIRLFTPNTSVPAAGQSFAKPATLALPLPAGVVIPQGTAVTVAAYDSLSHQWKASGPATIGAGNIISADVAAAGQYALVLPDPAPNAPPVPTAGAPLAPAAAVTLAFDTVATAGKVVPQAAPPSAGLRAAGELLVTPLENAASAPLLTSGQLLNGRVTEKYDLHSGDKVTPAEYVQDIVLYRYPCLTNIAGGANDPAEVSNVLRTTFPVSPSKDYTIVDLMLGKVGIAVTPPDNGAADGVMVGADGARLLDADGTVLVIPAGALAQTVPVSTKTVPGDTVAALVGSDFLLIKAVEVNLTRQVLAKGATISIAAPQGFNAGLPVVVAKQIDVKGTARLKLVAMGKTAGSMITSDDRIAALSPANTAEIINAAGIVGSGTYYFLQARGSVGFVTGTVADSTNAPYPAALITAAGSTLADLTATDGRYLIAAPVAPVTVTALDIYKNDQAQASGVITGSAMHLTLDLAISMVAPQLVAIDPANGATNVEPNVQLVLTFSKPMDKAAITGDSVVLRDAANAVVPGVFSFSADGKVVTFYPSSALASRTAYSLTIAGTLKDLQGYPLGQDLISRFTVRNTTPPPPPAAGSITASFPDADGFVTVTATQGSSPTDCTVLLINDNSGEIVSLKPESNGSFTGKIIAQLGDQIKVVLMDPSGNQTTVSYLTYKSDDGKYLVTAKGGKVEGEGGSILDIPEGALVGPTVIKVTAVQEAALPQPVPEGGKYLAAFHVDANINNFEKEVHLSIPVPEGFDPKTPVFLTKPSQIYNADGTVEQVYEVIDSTKIVNGRITTASPPFPGMIQVGFFVIMEFPYYTMGIVSGYTYQEMNDQPGYQQPPYSQAEIPTVDASGNPVYQYDRPIKGAVIRTPDAWNYVSYSGSNGFYAGFTTIIGNVGQGSIPYKITAINPRTMNRVNLTTYLDEEHNIAKLNIKLAEKNTILPDKTPPLIEMSLQEAADQPLENRLISGSMVVGTELRQLLFITDQSTVNPAMTVEYKSPEMISWQPYSVPLVQQGATLSSAQSVDKPAIWRYSYQPAFPSDLAGSGTYNFKPSLPGIYRLTVEATDSSGNKSDKKTLQVRVVPKGSIPDGVDGAPVVDAITPADGSTDLAVTTTVAVWFSEPVDKVNSDTFKLIDTTTGQPVPAIFNTDVSSGRMYTVLTPLGNLSYDRRYEVVLTTGIVDINKNPSAGDSFLPLAQEYRASFTTKSPTAYALAGKDQFDGGRDIALYTADDGRTYAYIAAGDQGWSVIDATDPTNLSVLATKNNTTPTVNWSYRGVAVHPNQGDGLMAMTDNIAFASGDQYGYVRFYDIKTNPINPAIVGKEKLAEAYSGIPGRVALFDDYAYVSTAVAGLQVVSIRAAKDYMANNNSISDGSSIVGVYDSMGEGYGSPNDIVVYGAGKALLTTNPGYLLVLDVNNPLPVLMSYITPDKVHAFRVAAEADFRYFDDAGNENTMDLALVGGGGRLKTIDLSNPYDSNVLATVVDDQGKEVTSYPYEISISKTMGLAFVTTMNAIQVVDLKDPKKPRLLNTIPPPGVSTDAKITSIGAISAVVERNGWLYMADQNTGMRTLDLDAGTVVCTKENYKFELERVHHLSQFATVKTEDYYTDSYVVFPFDLTTSATDLYVKVTISDRKSSGKKFDYIPEILLKQGVKYNFVVDYATIANMPDLGLNPKDNPEFSVKIYYRPPEIPASQPTVPQVYVGMLRERSDGKVMGQTIVHDVMVQDGSLNLGRQDFVFPGRGPQLSFSRSYNNQSSATWVNPLGRGWSQSLDMRLVPVSSTKYTGTNPLPDWLMTVPGANNPFIGHFFADDVLPVEEKPETQKIWTVVQVNGTTFKKTDNDWLPERGRHGILKEYTGDRFVYTDRDGTNYTYSYPKTISQPGTVRKIEDRNGNTMMFAYNNGSGLLESVTDAVGRTCSFAYEFLPICDSNPARLVSVTCPGEDMQLSFTYSPQGSLETITRGPKSEKYEYKKKISGTRDGDFNLVTATDANGHSFNYDYFDRGEVKVGGIVAETLKSEGVVKHVEYPDGNKATFAYDGDTRTVTDPRNENTTYTLNRFGNPTQINEPLGKTTRMTWSIDEGKPDNVVTSLTDPRNNTTTYDHDPRGNVISETDPNGNSIITTWHQFYNFPMSREDRNGVTRSWAYDANGNVAEQTDGDGKTTTFSYNGKGERLSMTDPRGNATTYTYDQWGNPDKVTAPEGSATDYDYDIRGRLVAVTDPNGRKTGYAYDQLDHLTAVNYPTLSTTGSAASKTYSYDAVGNLLRETDRAGLTLTYAYTPRNQVKSITRSGGDARSFEYDGNGNLKNETDWKGKLTSHFYDALNRRVNTVNRLNKIMIMSYDLVGNIIRVQDYNGNSTAFEYDALNRPVKKSLLSSPGGDLIYSYNKEADPKTNLLSETDQEGHVTAYEYNGRYLRTKRTDAMNGVHTWQYDDAGNLSSETDEETRNTVFGYDNQNRLVTVTRPLGVVTSFQYDPAGNRIKITDPRGYVTETKYDEWNRPWKVIDPELYTVVTEYDNEGRDIKVTDSNAVARLKTRDIRGRVLSYTDGEEKNTSFTYDANDNVTSVTEANGTVTTNTYDVEDRLLTSTETSVTGTRARQIVSRDNMGNPLQVKDYNGNVTTITYNALNLPVTVTDALEKTAATDYYKTGKVKSVTNRRGFITSYEYDGLNRLTTVKDPLGQTVVTSYDKVGNVKTIKDKRGITSENFYDELNRPIRRERAGIRLVSSEYDKNGNKTAEIDANGNRTEYVYTKRNLLDTVTFADATTRKRTYDGNGNPLTEVDEMGKVTTYTYDKENRTTSAEFAGEKTSNRYDAVGNMTQVIKPLDNSRVMAYDGFRRLTGVTDGNLTTYYEYDPNGNLLREFDPKNNKTEYIYDVLNRKTSYILADGNATGYTYDNEGNLLTYTDPKGQVANYTYDELDRLTDVTYPGNSSPFYTLTKTQTSYDGNNNVTGVTETKQDQEGKLVTDSTVNVYDTFDRLTSSTQRGVAITYAYDNNGNRTGVTTPNGATTYTYDNRNNVATATTGNAVSNFAYYPDGKKKTAGYANGATESLDYYDNNRVKEIANKKGNTIISSYSYVYDKNGNRTKQTEMQNGMPWTTTYGYDGLDRLQGFTVSYGAVTAATDYTFDGYNRATEKVTENGTVKNNKVYSYNTTNRLLSVVDAAAVPKPRTITYDYDKNGNTIRQTDSNYVAGYDLVYTYDSLDRLVQAKQGENVMGLYDYDADGLRIRHRNSGRGDVDYYYDGIAVAEERNAADNSLLARYSYVDQLLSLNTPAGAQYYHHDALGSTVNLTDAAGATQVSYVLDPWGHIVSQEGDSVNRQIFTGQEYDQNTGLIYFGARYYDPDTGRFITQDDYLGGQDLPPSLHRYLYAYSNPTVYIDEDGNYSATVVGAVAGYFWGFGQMGLAMGRDLYNGSSHSTGEYLGLWGRNILGGAEMGAAIDLGGRLGGFGGAIVGGALGGAGYEALTFNGFNGQGGQSLKEFGRDQLVGAGSGAILGAGLYYGVPLIAKIPGVQKAATWAGKTLMEMPAVQKALSLGGKASEKILSGLSEGAPRIGIPKFGGKAALTNEAAEAVESAAAKSVESEVESLQRIGAKNGGMGSEINEVADQQWMRSQGEWTTGRVSKRGEALPNLFEYRFPKNASRQGLGFVEEEHHVRPRWLGGAKESPKLRMRMGLHRGAVTGIHQEMNRWLVERGVIPVARINDAAYIRQAVRSGELSKSILKRELYLFYRTKYPSLPSIPKMLQDAFME